MNALLANKFGRFSIVLSFQRENHPCFWSPRSAHSPYRGTCA